MNVLIFHRVLPEPDPLAPSVPDVRAFRALMREAARCFHVLPLSDAIQRLRSGSLPNRALSITFDDGYLDNLELAGPVLKELGLPATVFVATGFLSAPMMFNDRVIEAVRAWTGDSIDLREQGLGRHPSASAADKRACISALLAALKYHGLRERDARTDAVCGALGYSPRPGLMMRPEHIPRLADVGFEVGAHTVNHPILSLCGSGEAEREVRESKAALEELAQRPITLFAYPNGKRGQDYEQEHVDIVRDAGFEAAFSTARGVVRRGGAMFELPRFTPWNQEPRRFIAKLLVHGFRPGSVS